MNSTREILGLIGRDKELFIDDINKNKSELSNEISNSSFLVIGGAGSIGQSVTKEIFKRNPRKLHVVEISENNMVELVRDIRSTLGYINGEFRTYAIDCGSEEFEALIKNNSTYDYVFNLSALKHVRSEKDKYTLMRMIEVNIINTIKTFELAHDSGTKKYFCVSTDKAANPVNMMGASKYIMEKFLVKESHRMAFSSARFANVAFSDGSLLHGFNQRLMKKQPIAAPNDIKRYFITPQESGELCLLSGIFGENRDTFFPKLNENLDLIKFTTIAEKYLRNKGFEIHICESEDEARNEIDSLTSSNKWPCYFFKSDTTGEKDYEEFYTDDEKVNFERFKNIGIIINDDSSNEEALSHFYKAIIEMKEKLSWDKVEIVKLFNSLIKNFDHKETGKYLDGRM